VSQPVAFGMRAPSGDTAEGWPKPDLSVLTQHRRAPPKLPIAAFGPAWGEWIENAAEAAACPPDYVAAPLLAAASALIGHARWAEATPGWIEPPHLWLGAVGDSGTGKSPGADCLMRDVLPEIERRMLADFPDQLRSWRLELELNKAAKQKWQHALRARRSHDLDELVPPQLAMAAEPLMPRLRQHDVTVEKVAELLARAAPKGLLIVRDELAGWIGGMNAHNGGGRAFWIEAYGGRPYRVERKTDPAPIVIPRLAVAVYGGTQPDKLANLIREADDGLLGRFMLVWPDPVRFHLSHQPPRTKWAIRALDRLRELDLNPTDPPAAILVPLAAEGRTLIENFARDMQWRQRSASGLFCSTLGKARGQALRLALVLEMLWWCGEDGRAPPASRISSRAVEAATALIDRYFLPVAQRAYAIPLAAMRSPGTETLARWIIRAGVTEVDIRHLQKEVTLSGLRTAGEIRRAADSLVAIGWLSPPAVNTQFGPRARVSYPVNPRLWDECARR
jgi:Protein of unknown function (DUF3987)